MKAPMCPKCRGNMIYPNNIGGFMEDGALCVCVSCGYLFGKILGDIRIH